MLTRIARPSKAEGPAREHLLTWAAARSFAAQVDAEGNIVVGIPATAGRERAPVVVLQAHLDIVCERDPTSPFDPREGRIDVRVEEDWVRADGTTLGADNGIGVAAAMAVADDAKIEHGPLELLFTVSEEQGLDGAKALDAGARLRAHADQSRRDERRRSDDRMRRERSHVPSRPARPRARTAGSRRTPDRALRSAGRALRWRHHCGPGQRHQGARTGARGESGATRCIRRRRQPECDPERRVRHRRGPEERRGRLSRSRRGRARDDRPRVRGHGRPARALVRSSRRRAMRPASRRHASRSISCKPFRPASWP